MFIYKSEEYFSLFISNLGIVFETLVFHHIFKKIAAAEYFFCCIMYINITCLVAHMVKHLTTMRRPRFYPWLGKIPEK